MCARVVGDVPPWPTFSPARPLCTVAGGEKGVVPWPALGPWTRRMYSAVPHRTDPPHVPLGRALCVIDKWLASCGAAPLMTPPPPLPNDGGLLFSAMPVMHGVFIRH